MKHVTTINYNGVDCHVYEPTDTEKWIAARKRLGRIDRCALVGKKLTTEGFYMFMNNYALFPNCFADKVEADALGLEHSIELITNSWNKAQKYKHWFVDEA